MRLRLVAGPRPHALLNIACQGANKTVKARRMRNVHKIGKAAEPVAAITIVIDAFAEAATIELCDL